MSKQTISERLGYVLVEDYVFTSKLDAKTLKKALAESSGRKCGKGMYSGKVLVRVRQNRVTLNFFTLKGGAVMGPVFKGRLDDLSVDGCTLTGRFGMTWFEKLAFTLMRIGTTYGVLKIIIQRPIGMEPCEYYLTPILMMVAWAGPRFFMSLPRTRIDMMAGHLREVGFSFPSQGGKE